MHFKLFTALPDYLSDTAKKLLFESQINERNGLISWPRVVKYSVMSEFKEKIYLHNPPLNDIKYLPAIANTEAYGYLVKTGWIYDPKHTGRSVKEFTDNRKAPGA